MDNNLTYQPKKWSELSYKDKGGYSTAYISFILGFILVFAGFFINPMGVIDGSVLAAFGTALIYTGGIFGVAMYVKGSKSEIYADLTDKLEKKMENHFREKERNHNDIG